MFFGSALSGLRLCRGQKFVAQVFCVFGQPAELPYICLKLNNLITRLQIAETSGHDGILFSPIPSTIIPTWLNRLKPINPSTNNQ
jgi:hypothetical protein